jgi:hypothetical protein
MRWSGHAHAMQRRPRLLRRIAVGSTLPTTEHWREGAERLLPLATLLLGFFYTPALCRLSTVPVLCAVWIAGGRVTRRQVLSLLLMTSHVGHALVMLGAVVRTSPASPWRCKVRWVAKVFHSPSTVVSDLLSTRGLRATVSAVDRTAALDPWVALTACWCTSLGCRSLFDGVVLLCALFASDS